MTQTRVEVPDIGDAENVDVIEVLVEPGARVEREQSLIVLESDKASMEIPSPAEGVVKEVSVKVGDKVSQGNLILLLEQEGAGEAEDAGESKAKADRAPKATPKSEPEAEAEQAEPEAKPKPEPEAEAEQAEPGQPAPQESGGEPEQRRQPGRQAPQRATAEAARHRTIPPPAFDSLPPQGIEQPEQGGERIPHATPSVRRFARELGVDLGHVPGTGRKGRITREDVQRYVKHAMSVAGTATGLGFAVPELPEIDFSQFGEIAVQPLTKIQKLSGQNLHRSWITIPHVTQFDEADITELEEFRKKMRADRPDVKLTLTSFFMKAVVVMLKAMPRFNASLDPSGENLILKRYYHLGVAVDTPNGLVVPVIRDVDIKGLHDLADELSDVSERARQRRLSPKHLQGASMTISSLGGIGGTHFTPIINPPEVAVLGVSRATLKPMIHEGKVEPRLMCGLSLSYDHRVIDGADAVRFTTRLREVLGDIRQMLL